MEEKYEVVIGLEVHIQLNSETKAFSNDANKFIVGQNQNISSVNLALPGTLPVANKDHILKGAKLGLATGGVIPELSYYDRKNYFYPDLPKGYQITQDHRPISLGGTFRFYSENEWKERRIHHIHMEEDAGKTIHDRYTDSSAVDYNRAGTPLLEVVTEPDFRSSQEVYDFLEYLQRLVRYLDISDGNMEEGSLRCDCNVSIRLKGDTEYGERCEVKNVNSKRFARQAIDAEAARQISLIEKGLEIQRGTLLFDPVKLETRLMRKKEAENDYRIFLDPDLPPVALSVEEISQIQSTIDWDPLMLADHLKKVYELSDDDAQLLTEHKLWAIEFIRYVKEGCDAKELSNLVSNKVIPEVRQAGEDWTEVLSLEQARGFILLIRENKINKSKAYQILAPALLQSERSALEIANELELITAEDQGFLDEVIEKVLNENDIKVQAYRSGKQGLFGFFMGQVMRHAGKGVDPQVLKSKLENKLG